MADALQIIYYIFGKTVDWVFTYEVVEGVPIGSVLLGIVSFTIVFSAMAINRGGDNE